MQLIEDVYEAGEFAEGLGHYIRVAIVRLLAKYGDMSITDVIKKLEEDYDIRTSYANLLAHIRKLTFTGICEEIKINNMKGLHLIRYVDIYVIGGDENGKGEN